MRGERCGAATHRVARALHRRQPCRCVRAVRDIRRRLPGRVAGTTETVGAELDRSPVLDIDPVAAIGWSSTPIAGAAYPSLGPARQCGLSVLSRAFGGARSPLRNAGPTRGVIPDPLSDVGVLYKGGSAQGNVAWPSQPALKDCGLSPGVSVTPSSR
jgi:hypothetical protein